MVVMREYSCLFSARTGRFENYFQTHQWQILFVLSTLSLATEKNETIRVGQICLPGASEEFKPGEAPVTEKIPSFNS